MNELVTLVIKNKDSNMRKLEILTAALASLLIFIMPATAAWNFNGMGGKDNGKAEALKAMISQWRNCMCPMIMRAQEAKREQ